MVGSLDPSFMTLLMCAMQVQGVSEAERDAAWKRIKFAAKKLKVELNEEDWRELG